MKEIGVDINTASHTEHKKDIPTVRTASIINGKRYEESIKIYYPANLSKKISFLAVVPNFMDIFMYTFACNFAKLTFEIGAIVNSYHLAYLPYR